jgi:hypothetical protein
MFTPIEVNELFHKAEAAIKRNEADGARSIVAINELRMAGKHLSRYIILDNSDEKQKELDAAAKHCERAIRDSIDIQFLLTKESTEKYIHQDRLKNYAALIVGVVSLLAALISFFVG